MLTMFISIQYLKIVLIWADKFTFLNLIDRTSLAEKTRRRSSGHLQYRSFGYQMNGKQNSAEITNNQTIEDIRIVKQQA